MIIKTLIRLEERDSKFVVKQIKEAKISQASIARECNITRQALNMMLMGQINITEKVIEKLKEKGIYLPY